MPDLLHLRCRSLHAALAPDIGGAVAGLWLETETGRLPLLRAAPNSFSDPRQSACFPMVPFCNRLRHGVLRFRSREISLPANLPLERHPLHGQGWQAAWRAEAISAHQADMVFDHAAGDWPWRYQARQRISLDQSGATLSLHLINQDLAAMPAGLGLHPYFPADPDSVLNASVRSVSLTDAEHLATGTSQPAQGAYSLQDRRIAGINLDHGFSGWDGAFTLTWPGRPLGLRMTAAMASQWLQIYAPSGQDYVCAEPMTHANDAFAAPESDWMLLGVRCLEPGETMSLEIRLQTLGL